MADLNGDGHDDVLSGSYWPGNIFVFDGEGKAMFAKRRALVDESGQKLHGATPWPDEKTPNMDSLAAAPWLIDFDADGDLDLLIGNIAGRVILIDNLGSKKAPKFARTRVRLQAGGKDIRVPGGDAGPTTVDWDGDGKWDLLVGAGDGSVWWYRNVGRNGAPEFAAGVRLIDAPARGGGPVPWTDEPKEHGSRTKVHAVDYDGDGRLDLLVGDFNMLKQAEPRLSETQTQKRDALRAERSELQTRLNDVFKKYKTLEDRAKREAAMKPITARFTAIFNELRPFEAKNDPTGWVWLFVRKTPADSNAPVGE